MRAGANNTGGKERNGYMGYARRRKRRWSETYQKKKIGKDKVG